MGPKKCIKIFSDYTPFDQVRGGEGGGVKIEKCSECHGKPKKCIKIFSDYTPFDQVGGGGGVLNFECLFLQEYLSYLLQILICCRAHPGLSVCQI